MFKVAVVGSRKFWNTAVISRTLDGFAAKYGIASVVSGGAEGADEIGEAYAEANDIPTTIHLCKSFLVDGEGRLTKRTDWETHMTKAEVRDLAKAKRHEANLKSQLRTINSDPFESFDTDILEDAIADAEKATKAIYGKSAKRRNGYIVRDADIVLAFLMKTPHHGKGYSGTHDTITKAEEKGMPIFTYYADRGVWERSDMADSFVAAHEEVK